MVIVIKPSDEFFEILIESLGNVEKRHCFKITSKVLKRQNSIFDEQWVYSLADLSENCSFVVQDEVQGYLL